MSPEYKLTINLNLPSLEEAGGLITEITKSRGVTGIAIEELYTGNGPQLLKSLLPEILTPDELKLANQRRGEIIKSRRLRLGLTQREMANTLGITPSTINILERGKSRGSYLTLSAIADVLRFPSDDPQRLEMVRGAAKRTPRIGRNHPIRARRPL